MGDMMAKRSVFLDIIKDKGGDKTEWKNLLLACKYCNTRKSNKTTSENKNDYARAD